MGRLEVDRRSVLKVLFLGGAVYLSGCGGEKTQEVQATASATVSVNPHLLEQGSREVAMEMATQTVEAVTEKTVYYDKERVERVYVMEGGRMEGVVVNDLVMKVVAGLNIQVEGDITDLLIRAIPVDNADKTRFPDSLGIRFSE